MTETPVESDRAPLPMLVLRGGIGGVLMGLANLVPGISGGTMLLAAGVYPRFISAIGEVTTLRFRKPSIALLAAVIGAALVAVVALAGPVKDLVVSHRWVMYSLFIGLTLGGVPVVWRLIGPRPRKQQRRHVWGGAVVGFIAMAVLAYFQMHGGGDGSNTGWLWMLCAGAVGASAMILPGVSGGYMLLVMGVYVPILAAIDQFKDAAQARDVPAMMGPGMHVVLPVGIGVVLGVVVISNLLRWLLARHERATLGVLLGLLLGAVVGLWPFQQGVPPEVGDTIKGQTVQRSETDALVLSPSNRPLEPEDYPTAFFTPTAGQVVGSLTLIATGFAVTMLIDLIGRERP